MSTDLAGALSAASSLPSTTCSSASSLGEQQQQLHQQPHQRPRMQHDSSSSASEGINDSLPRGSSDSSGTLEPSFDREDRSSDGDVTVQLDLQMQRAEADAALGSECTALDDLARPSTMLPPSLLSSFTSSPFRVSSLPPFGPIIQRRPKQSDSQAMPQLPSLSPPHSSGAAILASRLRQERDEAIASLAYCTVENDITVNILQEELQELRSGRDILKQDLQAMVRKLIEGERAQQRFEQVTDTLCQTESSLQQAKGRLETAYVELDELRARLEDRSMQSAARTNDPTPQTCSCRAATDLLRKDNADLEEELDQVRRQHSGSGNLVLSLQGELDQRTEELLAANRNSENQTLQSQHLQRLLSESQETARRAEERLQAETEIHHNVTKAHIARADNSEETLKDTQVQLRGAVNRALTLQKELDEQQADLAILKAEKQAVELRLASVQGRMLLESEDAMNTSARAESLQAEVSTLETSLERLVLVQLQSRRALRAHADASKVQADLSAPRESDKPSDPLDPSNLIIVLIKASSQLRKLQGRYNSACQTNKQLVVREESLRVENENLASRLAETSKMAAELDALTHSNADLCKQISALQAEAAGSSEEMQAAKQLADAAVARTEELEADLESSARLLEATLAELQEGRKVIAGLELELASTRESLRNAEEEGRNLVADFNMLSEELEQRQQQDETRTAKMVEANVQEEAMRVQRSLHDTAVTELNERLKTLEADLEQMHISVEETEDKYLESLKTIKKQTLQLDKLKVRNEALSRANSILERSIPTSASSPMEPTRSAAQKRALPRDFIAPDPGPAAVIANPSPSLHSRRLKNVSPENASGTTIDTGKRTASQEKQRSAPSTDRENERRRNYGFSDIERRHQIKPHNPELDADKKSVPPTIHRAPLAPVTGQRSLHPPTKPSEKDVPKPGSTATTSLSSRVPFKPAPGLNGKVHAKPPPSADTRSLLATLHALRRPA